MEGVQVGVGWPPAGAAGWIGADHMIVGEHVQEAEFFRGLGVVFDNRRIVTDLSLRKNDSDSHKLLLSAPRLGKFFNDFRRLCKALISPRTVRTLVPVS